jgi:hypothetical protein
VGAMDTTAIRHHHDLFPSFAKDGHDLMEILPKVLGIKRGHDFIEDAGGPVLHSANDVKQYSTGAAASRAIAPPDLAFEAFLAFDLAPAQRTCRQAIPVGTAPPAQPGQSKTPQDGFVFIQQNDLVTTGPVLESC